MGKKATKIYGKYPETINRFLRSVAKAYEENNRWDKEYVCNWGLIFSNDEHYLSYENHCHVGLTRTKYLAEDGGAAIKYIGSSIQRLRKGRERIENYKEHREKFIRWFVSDSMFKEAIVYPDPDAAVEDEFLFFDTHYNCNYVVASIIALRVCSEFPSVLRAWSKFVDMGMNGNQAFLIAHNITNTFQIQPINGHSAVNGGRSVQYCEDYLIKRAFDLKGFRPYRKEMQYDNIHYWFLKSRPENERYYDPNNEFTPSLKEIFNKVGEKKDKLFFDASKDKYTCSISKKKEKFDEGVIAALSEHFNKKLGEIHA